ncbi:acid protease [Rickenella mellea]|uniref:Acid protease n=1 Tax=Rickenella mellea TaxID=50990 RepID=A0A4Y7Q816_9AGAM|nr:acid protease [Rickenella mellea]
MPLYSAAFQFHSNTPPNMRVALLPLLLLFTFLGAPPSNAIKVPLSARPREGGRVRRMDMLVGSTVLHGLGDIAYFCNISLGGIQHSAMIDTGSSDFWVTKTVTDSKVLKVHAEIDYAMDSASGPVQLANLMFDDLTILDQAYCMSAYLSSNTNANISLVQAKSSANLPADALIGLGPGSNSIIRLKLGNSTGDPPLDRIFGQTLSPKFISVLLDRKAYDDDGMSNSLEHTGQLTIGEFISGLEAVNNQPKLPALKDSGTGKPKHWQTTLDPDVSMLQIMFDMGFTFPQVPKEVADGIYGKVPGSVFAALGDNGIWTYPCDYELNVSLKLGGISYPVHSLDLGMPLPELDSNTCLATFQQRPGNFLDFADVDMILGAVFMHNTYTLVSFGDFVDGSSSNVSEPFIQLLSNTDVAGAHSDFVNLRLGGVDTTGTQAPLLPSIPRESRRSNENLSSESDGGDNSEAKWSVSIVVSIVALAVLGSIILYLIVSQLRSGYPCWQFGQHL